MPRPLELLHDLGDGMQGLLGCSAWATDEKPIVRRARELSQRALLLGPVHVQHRHGDSGPHRADDAPVR